MATVRAPGPVLEKMRTPWEERGKRRQKSPHPTPHRSIMRAFTHAKMRHRQCLSGNRILVSADTADVRTIPNIS